MPSPVGVAKAWRHCDVRSAATLNEVVKWGHGTRVRFGFWRGRQLRTLEPRLRPGGKYDMATLELRAGDTISAAVARRLTKEAVRLNAELGDPTA